MTNHNQPTPDHPTPTYYEPRPADISTVQDQGQNKPIKTLPLQLTINFSIGVIVLLLLAAAYYYKFLPSM